MKYDYRALGGIVTLDKVLNFKGLKNDKGYLIKGGRKMNHIPRGHTRHKQFQYSIKFQPTEISLCIP